MNDSCCKNCEKRTYKCHSTCESYIAFDRERKRILAEKHKNYDFESAYADSMARKDKKRR
jgi:hypothetical protein